MPFAKYLVTALLVLVVTTASSGTCARTVNLFGMEHPYLRGVRIEMKDGRRLVGYVAWSSESTESTPCDKEPKFPQSLIDPTNYPEEIKTLELYTKLYPVSKKVLRRAFPGGGMRMVVAIASGTLRLPLKQTAGIKALRMKYDGIEATIDGMITDIHSLTIIRLLISGRPFATLKNDDYGYVLVSFNSQIGRRKLAAINAAQIRLRTSGDADTLKALEQTTRRLERQRIVVIEFITED